VTDSPVVRSNDLKSAKIAAVVAQAAAEDVHRVVGMPGSDSRCQPRAALCESVDELDATLGSRDDEPPPFAYSAFHSICTGPGRSMAGVDVVRVHRSPPSISSVNKLSADRLSHTRADK